MTRSMLFHPQIRHIGIKALKILAIAGPILQEFDKQNVNFVEASYRNSF